jgi:hypothetical protein
MLQSTYMQYITKYFIKYNYLNHLKNIFAFCNILLQILSLQGICILMISFFQLLFNRKCHM